MEDVRPKEERQDERGREVKTGFHVTTMHSSADKGGVIARLRCSVAFCVFGLLSALIVPADCRAMTVVDMDVTPWDSSVTFTNAYHQCRKALRIRDGVGLCLLEEGNASNPRDPIWTMSFRDMASNQVVAVRWKDGNFDKDGLAKFEKVIRNQPDSPVPAISFDEVMLMVERSGYSLGSLVFADKRTRCLAGDGWRVGMRDFIVLEVDCRSEMVMQTEDSKKTNWEFMHMKESVLEKTIINYESEDEKPLRDIIECLFERSFRIAFIYRSPLWPRLEYCFTRKLRDSGLLEKRLRFSVGRCTAWEAFEALSRKVPVKFRIDRASMIVSMAEGDDENPDELERLSPWNAIYKPEEGSQNHSKE